MRKIFIVIFILLSSGVLFAKEQEQSIESRIIEAYKTGHQQGVNQIEREFVLQGWEKKRIYPKQYLVILDISNIPKNEILLYKNYAFFEGLLPLTVKSPSKSIILFGSYDRKIDAKSLARDLNKKIPVKNNKILFAERENGMYYKTPFIYKYLFDRMLKKIKQNVKAKVYIVSDNKSAQIKTKVVKADPKLKKSKVKKKVAKKSKPKLKKSKVKKKVAKKSKPKLVLKKYKPKYKKIQTYRYTGEWVRYSSPKWRDDKFEFVKFINKDKIIKSYNTVTTYKGMKYVKMVNKNLYVEADYVKQIK